MENKICVSCGNPFIGTKLQKFCCHRCNARYNSRIRYQKIKNTEEYKEKSYQNTKKWVQNNRERFNALCLANYHKKRGSLTE